MTAATGATTAEFIVTPRDLPLTLVGYGFAGADSFDIQISHDGGTTYADVVEAGVTKSIDANDTTTGIYAPGMFRINKGITGGSVGASLSVPGDL